MQKSTWWRREIKNTYSLRANIKNNDCIFGGAPAKHQPSLKDAVGAWALLVENTVALLYAFQRFTSQLKTCESWNVKGYHVKGDCMHHQKDLFENLLEQVEKNVNSDTLEKAIWEQYGETCAVLILDSTGFSKTTQKRGIVFALSVIARMRTVGARVFKKHGVLGIRAEADNLFAEFSTVDDAVNAAFEMHQYFKENQLMLADDEPYGVCIGIGYGRLLKSTGEGMYGDEMNLASKLGEDTADGGDTFITEAAFQALKNRDGLISHRRFVNVSEVQIPFFSVSPSATWPISTGPVSSAGGCVVPGSTSAAVGSVSTVEDVDSTGAKTSKA